MPKETLCVTDVETEDETDAVGR